MGSNSFFTRLIIMFFIVAAAIGLVHLGGNSATSYLMKVHNTVFRKVHGSH
jgi:hypothetical protein